MNIVISRYNEDLLWCSNINHKKTIYNKGSLLKDLKSIEIPNVGREAHTYLYHIVNNYDTLDEYTMFLQGNPFDHGFTDNFMSSNLLNSISFKVPFFPLLRKEENFNYFVCDDRGRPHNNLEMVDFIKKHKLEKLFNNKQFYFVQGAQFVVSRERIHTQSLETYKHLLETLSDPENGSYAHIMERLWLHIFNCFPS
jgi:hypothetical protein